MNELTEKILLIAAGAAVGAAGYMAYKHPDEFKQFMADAMEHGQDFLDKQLKEMAENMPRPKEAPEKG